MFVFEEPAPCLLNRGVGDLKEMEKGRKKGDQEVNRKRKGKRVNKNQFQLDVSFLYFRDLRVLGLVKLQDPFHRSFGFSVQLLQLDPSPKNQQQREQDSTTVNLMILKRKKNVPE